MKKTVRYGAILAALVAFTAPAAALSVTNNDDVAYSVAVTAGDEQSEVTVEAGATVEIGCANGCAVTLMDSEGVVDEIDATEGDSVTIGGAALKKAE